MDVEVIPARTIKDCCAWMDVEVIPARTPDRSYKKLICSNPPSLPPLHIKPYMKLKIKPQEVCKTHVRSDPCCIEKEKKRLRRSRELTGLFLSSWGSDVFGLPWRLRRVCPGYDVKFLRCQCYSTNAQAILREETRLRTALIREVDGIQGNTRGGWNGDKLEVHGKGMTELTTVGAWCPKSINLQRLETQL